MPRAIQEALGADLPAHSARQAYQAVYRRRVESVDRTPELQAALRARLAVHSLGLPADNRTLGTVLMPEESRKTICMPPADNSGACVLRARLLDRSGEA